MTDPNYTAIMLVLDRSGSMSSIKGATEEAINGFIKKQKDLPGRATIAIAQFDDVYEIVNASIPPDQVPEYRLQPRGITALLDAIGKSIHDFGAELAAKTESERPGTVILAIMTDGFENASKEFTRKQIKDLVTRQQDVWNWTVLYLAANQDAILTGAEMGMKANTSMSYAASSIGTRAVTNSMSGAVYAAASAGPIGNFVGFSDEDREEAMDGQSVPGKK